MGQDEGTAASRGLIVTKIAVRSPLPLCANAYSDLGATVPRKLLEMKCWSVHPVDHYVRPTEAHGFRV